jgi:hypothetical protein
MNLSIVFEPFLPWPLLVVIATALAGLLAVAFYAGQRSTAIRALALTALLAALANPVILQEERDPVQSVVAVVVDRSQSQDIATRSAQTDETLAAIQQRLARYPRFDTRVIEAGRSGKAEEQVSTRLFGALNEALRDIPPGRVAGTIVITDGQIHDIPEDASTTTAPLHALITGTQNERDRQIRLELAPRFGITGKPLEFAYRVIDNGSTSNAAVTVRVNGAIVTTEQAVIGEQMPLILTLDNAGSNVVSLEVEEAPGEITTTNNRAVSEVDGIRENLRVLLVSGEPHAGERTWRNLLKSDASVDLVHFTILRPPEKQDGTPINELSLIAFPTRELFVEKIEDFDLIILDRYQHRDVLPILYYDYIAQYVQNGGALLIAAGPEYAGAESIARTPLLTALPALPDGQVDESAFFPRLTDTGARHPVTRGLDGSALEPPNWSRWFRSIGVVDPKGDVVMQAGGGKPLLILNRFGEGRVAMLLSDQGWLWARGFQGGGPHVALYRRIAHWLMREPELEEERLTASGTGMLLEISRQTMADETPAASVLMPNGETREIPLSQSQPGRFTATVEVDDIGLYQVNQGDLSALTHIGPVDAPEYAEVLSTTAKLDVLAKASGGSARRLIPTGTDVVVPSIVPVRGTTNASGADWIGLRETNETILRGVSRLPLFGGLFGLAVLILALGGMWWREGRT